MTAITKITCTKCHKTMDANKKFYAYKNGTKYDLCKSCMTMHMDPFDTETFCWALETLDLPYVEDEWNNLRDKLYGENPATTTGIRVFGKYLSKMKLKQWSSYGWMDTEMFAEEKKERMEKLAAQNPDVARREEEVRRQYENGEITETEYKTYMSSASLFAHDKEATDSARAASISNIMMQAQQTAAGPMGGPVHIPASGGGTDNFVIGMQLNADRVDGMSEEDKKYLISKWGSNYTGNELMDLEKKYIEMCDSFDIQDSDTSGTLILLCKVYVKMNQAIDQDDVEGFQKLSRTYNDMRKTSKFTAAQNKEEKSEFVDSIGELVAICEQDGFIPRYVTDIPQDKVDKTLEDMNSYVSNLVRGELGMGQLIDNAIKKIAIQQEMDEAEAQNDQELDDEDIYEYYDDLAEQKEADAKYMAELAQEEEEDV